VNKADVDDLLSRLKEMEELLHFPTVEGHMKRAEALALSIARTGPNAAVRELAMKVISEANALRRTELPLKPNDKSLSKVLADLRLSLEEARKGLPK
jgi:hypothetical protein